MYVKLSAIKGAASLVALVRSIFLSYFSIFHRIFLVLKKRCHLQNFRSLSKLEVSIDSLILDAIFTLFFY